MVKQLVVGLFCTVVGGIILFVIIEKLVRPALLTSIAPPQNYAAKPPDSTTTKPDEVAPGSAAKVGLPAPRSTSTPSVPVEWLKPLSGDEGQFIVRMSAARYISARKVGFQLYVQPISGGGSESLYLGDSGGEDNAGSFTVSLNGVDSNYIHCAGQGYPCKSFPGMPTYVSVEVERPNGINRLAFALRIAPGGGAWTTYDFTNIPVYPN